MLIAPWDHPLGPQAPGFSAKVVSATMGAGSDWEDAGVFGSQEQRSDSEGAATSRPVGKANRVGLSPKARQRAAKAKARGAVTPQGKMPRSSSGPNSSANVNPSPKYGNRCLRCPEPRYRKTRWCSLHRRAYDNMKAQAIEKGELDTFEKAMEKDDSASEMMQEWDELNPPSKKFKKKEVFNWAKFRVQYGVRRSEVVEQKSKRMDRKQFKAWGKYKQGWDSEEIEDEWNMRRDDPAIARDNFGSGGSLRLEIQKGETKESVASNVATFPWQVLLCLCYAQWHRASLRFFAPGARPLFRISE